MTSEPYTTTTGPTTAPPRRLTRSRSDRMLGGVCGGLGEYFAIDPVIVRLAMAVFALAGGGGIAVYLVAWLIVPEAGAVAAPTAAPYTPPAPYTPADADVPPTPPTPSADDPSGTDADVPPTAAPSTGTHPGTDADRDVA
ncbi:MAG: PspC domain-containing protein [Actinomycetota bacterium]|nr:PspC domain-containing protein [Actinomycetota bacterium]